MNVLLVTTAKNLAEKLYALNPELEYGAIVIDDVEAAKKTLAQIGLTKNVICSMDELPKCVEHLRYDYTICVQDHFYDWQINRLEGLPAEKIVSFAELATVRNWETERQLRYYKEHVQDFEMFVTGGINGRYFKYKTSNFARPSQDLYYNFQIAKSVMLFEKMGYNRIHYALIGLGPISFHFDLSRTFALRCRILPYVIALNNLHNFPLPIDVYKKFFRKEWLTNKPFIQRVNMNGPKLKSVMDNPLSTSRGILPCNKKYYPKTRDENK